MLCGCTLIACKLVDHTKYESKQFKYEKVVQTNAEVQDRLKLMDNKVYFELPKYSFDNSKGPIGFREVNDSLSLKKAQLLEIKK